ncbi:NAD(P)/FAD-dependent oxidoreductase [Pelagicoccus sp. SDUM812002]|uniref:NAD(P)/FAD-dependent oxidoreductase n=1 Tax=Pelagicoccus sp. SDUM812002 TaxID=3041266 RepID=UPI00280D03F2|nr:NAD(P)/FAD-dependent oxidoreductase [Pelagicoccus sp. SDUM812002]MDQ8187106.1 NAD(P)/FAD-dependent oxidoreductase [Pelagicoccus sp. SDUM812002]
MKKPHILVLGAGFAGIEFCKRIDGERFDVTLVDRQNHHLFQPLLYQVASSGLAVPEIAQPIRTILSGKKGLQILMDEAVGIDLRAKKVELRRQTIQYDYLLLAFGAVTGYFGNNQWARHAPGLKTVKDATRIRQSILYAYEQAETCEDDLEQRRLLTTVVIGGGPTGVELAGAFAELARHSLARDFSNVDPERSKVILIEAGDRVLGHMDKRMSEAALRQLRALGVDVRLNTRVENIDEGVVEIEGERIEAANILWGAGVEAHPLTRTLGVELSRGGKILVESDLSVPGFDEVFALGDIVDLVDAKGVRVPGVSPAAMQMAKHVASCFNGGCFEKTPAERKAFTYWDKGTMATIGRSKAVAEVKSFRMRGFIAWLAWLFVHLVFLIGFRNKVVVLFQWAYSYLTYRKGARIIHSAEDLDNPSVSKENDPLPRVGE